MKVSIVTVCFNSEKTVEATIKSVLSQQYKNIEYIVVDGGSSDGTKRIIKKNIDKISVVISEKDRGIYDAMNKGLENSTGDVIGFLNSDDVFASDAIVSEIVEKFSLDKDISAVIGDVAYYKHGYPGKKKRHYSSRNFNLKKFSRGFMPAHPSCYIRKSCYDAVGAFDTNYKIAGDFDMMLRIFSIPGFKFAYIDKEMIKMTFGGVSTSGIKANYVLNKEILDSCKKNQVKASWASVLSKYPEKAFGLIVK